MSADGFRYLSPWLPTKDGWYCIGHTGTEPSSVVHRWRLGKSHEHNAAGERWERWRLFYDKGVVAADSGAVHRFEPHTELAGVEIRDRLHARELVEQRFADISPPPARRARKAATP